LDSDPTHTFDAITLDVSEGGFMFRSKHDLSDFASTVRFKLSKPEGILEGVAIMRGFNTDSAVCELPFVGRMEILEVFETPVTAAPRRAETTCEASLADEFLGDTASDNMEEPMSDDFMDWLES